jgi:antitoxin CptB
MSSADETPETRLRRLGIRSIRRGIREMDLILGAFAADAGAGLAALAPAELDAYEVLLEENDHDLLAWITGAAPAPTALAPMIARIAAAARAGSPARYLGP